MVVKIPEITVITSFFNSGRFISETIDSVVAQSFTDFEYILVDDGSTDNSRDIVLRYCAKYPDQLRYVHHEEFVNRGVCASRNLGMELARGEFLAFVDADDVWSPSKLVDQLGIMRLHPEVGMVCGATCYWRSWEDGPDEVIRSGHVQDQVIRPPETSLCVYPLGDGPAPCPSDLLVKKSVAVSIGGFEEAFTGVLQLFEDQAFLSKLYLHSPVLFSSSVWLNYRLHEASCVASVTAAGRDEEARRYFFNWYADYLSSADQVDVRVSAALKEKRCQLGLAAWEDPGRCEQRGVRRWAKRFRDRLSGIGSRAGGHTLSF